MFRSTKLRWTFLVFSLIVAAGIYRLVGSDEWRQLSGQQFRDSLIHLKYSYLFIAAFFVFLSYIFRSLRWQQFLGTEGSGHFKKLFSATLVGFSAVALLGRPGELVRPVLIARDNNRSLSSQLAAWALERVLDSLTIGGLLGAALIWWPTSNSAGADDWIVNWRRAGLIFFAIAVLAGLILVQLRIKPAWTSKVLDGLFRPLPLRYRELIHRQIINFSHGLESLQSISRLVACVAYSLLVWGCVIVAFWGILQAFESPLPEISINGIALIMSAGAVGSIAQLPGIGGGMQIATALTLNQLFHVPIGLATSAAIWLWVITFMMVIPPGLALAAREGLNWQRLRMLSRGGESVT